MSSIEGVINLIKNNVKYCRLNSIGIGDSVSENLIKRSADAGKGKYIFINN